MFRNMKTGTKILFGLGIAIAILAAVGVASYWDIARVASSLAEMGEKRLPTTLGLEKMLAGQLEAVAGLAEATSGRKLDAQSRAEQYRRIEAGLKRAELGRKIYEPLPDTPEEAKMWQEFLPLWEAWKGGLTRTVEFLQERDRLLASGLQPDDPRIAALDDRILRYTLAVWRGFRG